MTKEKILQHYTQSYVGSLENKYPEIELSVLIQLNIEIKALYFKYVSMFELFLHGFVKKQLFINESSQPFRVINFFNDPKQVLKYLKLLNIKNYKNLNQQEWLVQIKTWNNEEIMWIIKNLKPEYLTKIQEYFEIKDLILTKEWIELIFINFKNYLINKQCFFNIDLDSKIDPYINEKEIKADPRFVEFSYLNTILHNLCKVHNLLPSGFNEEYEYFIDNFIPKQIATPE